MIDVAAARSWARCSQIVGKAILWRLLDHFRPKGHLWGSRQWKREEREVMKMCCPFCVAVC